MKKSITIIVSVLSVFFLYSCASTISVKKTIVNIDSEPKGASIYIFNANTYEEYLLGTAPGNYEIPQGEIWVFLKAKMDGFETESTMITSNKTNYTFKLKKEWMGQIMTERLNGEYSDEVIKGSLSILGAFDKALNSPRMLFSSTYKEGETKFRQFKLDFPEIGTTILMAALRDCDMKMNLLTMMENLKNTPYESIKVSEVQRLISHIQIGLGSY